MNSYNLTLTNNPKMYSINSYFTIYLTKHLNPEYMISDHGILRSVDICFEFTFYLHRLLEKLQVLSRMRMYTRFRDQQGTFCAIFHYDNMDTYCYGSLIGLQITVNAIILPIEYSCRRLIDSDFIGQ